MPTPLQSASPTVILGCGIALLLAYLLHSILYNLYRSPLSSIPGPKLWAISLLPSQLSVLRGRTHLDITRLHARYGPVVRIGPNEVAFNTPQAFRDIYGSRPGHKNFAKDRTHYTLPANGVDHLVSAIDDNVHARQRRLLAWAFSDKALREQEGIVTELVNILIARLREQCATGSPQDERARIDIKNWLNYTTFDILGSLMFGESFGCLEKGEMHPWIALLFNSIKALSFLGVVNQFPLLAALLERLIPKSVKQQGLDHFDLTAKKVDRRLEMGTDRADMMSAILKNGLSESEGQYHEDEKIMSRAEIHSNAFIMIIAGSETSATLLSGLFFHLCTHPAVMTRLVSEIQSTFPSSSSSMTFPTTSTLPYLNAIIEESLRIYPPFVTSLARVVPTGGAAVDGTWLPSNTTVACHHYASYHSASNFTQPDDFIPERWLGEKRVGEVRASGERDPRFANDNRDVLQPFSLGPRGCLGKNLAYAEIRLIVCRLLWEFEIDLCAESKDWMGDQKVWFLWDKPPLMVRLRERRRG